MLPITALEYDDLVTTGDGFSTTGLDHDCAAAAAKDATVDSCGGGGG